MKIVFLATAACVILSLSSSAQAQGKQKFSDQYCVPYCKNYCATPRKDGRPHHPTNCFSKCVPMCRELGH
jgi:hypothetical protein